MTGLRYTPKICAERLGLEPRQHLRADRLAICSVTTPAPLQSDLTFGLKVGAKILFKVDSNKKKERNFTILDILLEHGRYWSVFS